MNVLFICRGNVARSQEAEAFFNDFSEDDIATSAGIDVEIGKPIDPVVLTAMQEIDYGLPGAHRKQVDEGMVNCADLIISFVAKDELPAVVQSHHQIRYWDVSDPRHQSIEIHRRVRDDINQRVRELVAELDG